MGFSSTLWLFEAKPVRPFSAKQDEKRPFRPLGQTQLSESAGMQNSAAKGHFFLSAFGPPNSENDEMDLRYAC